MRPRFFFWTLSLIAVLAASSCAPAATNVSSEQAETPALATRRATATETSAGPQATKPVLAATAPVDIQVIATSRGPDLHATDPTTVNLASGQLQLVEFFRFT